MTARGSGHGHAGSSYLQAEPAERTSLRVILKVSRNPGTKARTDVLLHTDA